MNKDRKEKLFNTIGINKPEYNMKQILINHLIRFTVWIITHIQTIEEKGVIMLTFIRFSLYF
jgi:hypothetical protein